MTIVANTDFYCYSGSYIYITQIKVGLLFNSALGVISHIPISYITKIVLQIGLILDIYCNVNWLKPTLSFNIII